MPHLGLDLHEAARVADGEKYGDWYRDPWGWPEVSIQFAENLDPERDLGTVRNGRRYESTLEPVFNLFDVPKSFLGVRPAVVQDPKSRLTYTAAALSIARVGHASLPQWVYGWRYRDGSLVHNGQEWEGYAASKECIEDAEYAGQTDIASFFASIDIARLLARIDEIAGSGLSLSVVRRVAESHSALASRSGIPQRSTASALLAHLAMEPVDDLISNYLSSGDIASARRWMDDLSFEGTREALHALIVEIQSKARESGLQVNTAKTVLTTGRDSAQKLRDEEQKRIILPRRGSSPASSGGFASYLDPSELEELESQILLAPDQASRPRVVSVLRSLTYYEMFDRLPEWADASPLLPHGADALGRFVAGARSADGADLEDWFVAETGSAWRISQWVLAQHALAFSAEDLPKGVAEVLRGWLGSSHNLQQLAVAVHRLALTEPATVRSILTARIDSTRDPLVLRLVALGLLAARASRSKVRLVLELSAVNDLTLKYLVDRDWGLPPVSPDFDRPPEDGDEVEEGADEADLTPF